MLNKDVSTHLDHVISAAEIERNPKLNLGMTAEQRAKVTTDSVNLTYISSSANQSKGNQDLLVWANKPHGKTGKTNAEFYDLDMKLVTAEYDKAKKHVKKEGDKALFNKQGKELLSTGAKDAMYVGAYAMLAPALIEVVQAVFREVRATFKNKGNENLKEVVARFKTSLNQAFENIKNKFKDLFKDGIGQAITAFLSNMVVFVINMFATTLKRFVKMIRAGFVSLVQAMKILANPPAGMPKEEVRYQAVKVLIAGLIGVLSLALAEAIEKLLLAIPGLQPLMLFPLFGERTVSDAIAVVLSSLVGGLVTTIVLYYMDKFHNRNKDLEIKFQLVSLSGKLPQYAMMQTYHNIAEGYAYVDQRMAESKQRSAEVEQRSAEFKQQFNDHIEDVQHSVAVSRAEREAEFKKMMQSPENSLY